VYHCSRATLAADFGGGICCGIASQQGILIPEKRRSAGDSWS